MNKETLWVLDVDSPKFVKRDVNIVPGLYKIVDEIIVNAADNKVTIGICLHTDMSMCANHFCLY